MRRGGWAVGRSAEVVCALRWARASSALCARDTRRLAGAARGAHTSGSSERRVAPACAGAGGRGVISRGASGGRPALVTKARGGGAQADTTATRRVNRAGARHRARRPGSARCPYHASGYETTCYARPGGQGAAGRGQRRRWEERRAEVARGAPRPKRPAPPGRPDPRLRVAPGACRCA